MAVALSNLPFVTAGNASGSALADAGLPPTAIDLEAGHAELRRAALAIEHDVPPAPELGPAARAMEAAFGALYDVIDGRADRLNAVQAALTEIDRAGVALDAAAARDRAFDPARAHLGLARTHLARAEERYARLPPLALPATPELLASNDIPRLHTITRPSLVPTLRYPVPLPAGRPPPVLAPLPEPKTFPELRAAIAAMKREAEEAKQRPPAPALPPPPVETAKLRVPPPGFARDIGQAIDDAAFLRNRARESFEEVSMVGMQRAPMLGDPWRGSLLLERRMLASIDVIAAVGRPAIEHVPRLVADAPVKDPSHAFGIAMVLGCIGGRDALAAAEHALLTSDRDAAFVDEIGAALKLVPHDHLAPALRSLLGEADPKIRALAIDVLGYRGLATPAELVAAATDVPLVAARALVHFATTPTPELAGILQEAARTEDPALREAAWIAMALSGHPHTEVTLSVALDGPEAGKAALVLALAGDDRSARLVCDRTFCAPTRELLFAVGWTGDAWAIAQLVDLLATSEDAVLKSSAAWALERITAAGLWEEAEIEDDDITVDEPPDPDVGEPRVPKLARTFADPRDPPPAPAPEVIEQPSTDAARWRAWWQEHGPRYNMAARYRRGQLYTPQVSLSELDTARRTPAERRWLQRELIIRTGGFVRFDPHDLVMVQEEALKAWQPLAAQGSNTPGRWIRPARRIG
ncbi:Hypothetical protein A7982_04568 [Minicystis rosea]|nr:Hypothetical protein A7982_04568 [Minicystis rosea]